MLDDALGVRDRLAVEDEHRHVALAGELLDLGAVRLPVGDADLLVLDAVALALARHAPARAQAVRRGAAAVELGGGHQSPNIPARSSARRIHAPVSRSARGWRPA